MYKLFHYPLSCINYNWVFFFHLIMSSSSKISQAWIFFRKTNFFNRKFDLESIPLFSVLILSFIFRLFGSLRKHILPEKNLGGSKMKHQYVIINDVKLFRYVLTSPSLTFPIRYVCDTAVKLSFSSLWYSLFSTRTWYSYLKDKKQFFVKLNLQLHSFCVEFTPDFDLILWCIFSLIIHFFRC